MKKINLIFPNQLFENSPLIKNGYPVYLIEEYLFFRQYAFHKQKIAFHRATMKFYQNYLESKGCSVNYINAHEEISDVRKLISDLNKKNITVIHYIDTTDNWLEKRLINTCSQADIKLVKCQSQLFLNAPADLQSFFKSEKKKFSQTEFYIQQRRKRNILITDDNKPVGGKWSFDAENRKKYPASKKPPEISYPQSDAHYIQAREYTNKYFAENPGVLGDTQLYPVNFADTKIWFKQFFDKRFAEFGTYEDAIVHDQNILHHSVLTPMLNVGLITPEQVIYDVLDFIKRQDIPLNSAEGFIRQIIGWREFIRGMYQFRGTMQRTRNFWKFSRKIPASFYNATTGIGPLDNTIKKVLRTGYCHHIERLMVLGNFMMLCEFDPDEVYRWFMELFIDAYDWVMVPNVYGMSQFADGGLMSTKPYISGSNYLMKMSNYRKGDWQDIWDALFWRFMHIHRDFFTKNPRLGMLIKTFDKWTQGKKESFINTANNFLDNLE